jgi:hypothetical protein
VPSTKLVYMSTKRSQDASRGAVTGQYVTSVPGFVLVKDGTTTNGTPVKAAASESASSLVPKVARALSKSGVSKDMVFRGRTKNVYSYSVDVTDTTRVVRVAADGKRSVGRLVNGKFVAVKA